jgi:hypothetical protein
LLYEGGKEFTFVIEEPVLRCRIGDNDVMAGQLRHLADALSLPSVSLGVIPAQARRRMWPLEGFLVFDDATGQVELLSARVTVTRPGEIDLYVRAFTEMGQMAVYGSHARELICAALASFG